MQWLSSAIVLGVVMLPSTSVHAASCPGDLDGNGNVTISEIVTIVNAALNSCSADLCPGDLNGDHVVTIDEIMKAVTAALQGCATAVSPTATASPTPTPTFSPAPSLSPTATATLGHCPYTFTDDTLSLGASCGYAGAFSMNSACSTDLSALVLSDPASGNLVAVSIGSDPIITFGGVASSATQAAIVGYFVGSDLTPQPLTGVMQLSDDGNTLIIAPDTVPPFSIGATDCSFERYVGSFTGVISDQGQEVGQLRAAHIGALRRRLAHR